MSNGIGLCFILIIAWIGGRMVWRMVLSLKAGRSSEDGARTNWLQVFGTVLGLIGGLGFFGFALSASGAFQWLPETFEWPVGSASGVVTAPDGTHVVPLTSANRIQVYDNDWKFLRGWYVDASGGSFLIRIVNDSQIEVDTFRGRVRYIYGFDGSLLSKDSYAPLNHPGFSASGVSAMVPTPWWLWSFTSPFFSWGLFIIGLMLTNFSRRQRQAAGRL